VFLSALRQLGRHVATTRSPAGRTIILYCRPTGTSSVTDTASAESATPGVGASTAADSPSSPRGPWPASTARTMRLEPHSWALQQLSSMYCAFSSALLATIGGHIQAGPATELLAMDLLSFADMRCDGMNAVQHGSLLGHRRSPFWPLHRTRPFLSGGVRHGGRRKSPCTMKGGTGTPESLKAWRRHALFERRRSSCTFVRGKTPKLACLRHTSVCLSLSLSLSLHSARLSPFSPRALRAAAARPQRIPCDKCVVCICAEGTYTHESRCLYLLQRPILSFGSPSFTTAPLSIEPCE